MADKREHLSPSGKYRLIISLTVSHKGYWQFSIAHVEHVETDEIRAVVHRNYPSFPFCWVEDHPDGHDYLVCGEDYQGQTIIQLDTGLRKDYLPPSATRAGACFCWIDIEFEQSPLALRVEGCYWAFPYEMVRYDFSDPFSLPYAEIDRWTEDEEDEWEDE